MEAPAPLTTAPTVPPHILVVDDDREIRDLLARFLERQGFRVTGVRDAREARRTWPHGHFQLVVLDLMLPGESGLDFARWLRGQSERADRHADRDGRGNRPHHRARTRRRRLSRRSRSIRASCWRASAPCCAARATPQSAAPRPRRAALRFGGWTLEPPRRRLLNPDGVEVPLTGGEYDLLLALAERANRVLTRDMLLDLLRGRQAGPFDRAIDVAVSRLRRKLEDDGRHAQLIKTVRGGGYVLAAEVERE